MLSLICVKVVKHFSCFSPPQKCKKQVAAWSTNIKHHIQQEVFLLMKYCCQPITSSFFSKKNVSVQRWSSIPVELTLQSDSGILCGLLCYQSLSLVLIRLDQKLLLYFDRSFGSFLHFLQLWKRKKYTKRDLSVLEKWDHRIRHIPKEMAFQTTYLISSLAIRTFSCCNSPFYEKKFCFEMSFWSSHSPSKGLGSKHHNYETHCLKSGVCKLISK